jgi:hypothetical protein
MDWAGVEIGIAAAGLVALIGALWFWCACKVSGRISRMEERQNYSTKGEKGHEG